jgi:hypothetical protein
MSTTQSPAPGRVAHVELISEEGMGHPKLVWVPSGVASMTGHTGPPPGKRLLRPTDVVVTLKGQIERYYDTDDLSDIQLAVQTCQQAWQKEADSLCSDEGDELTKTVSTREAPIYRPILVFPFPCRTFQLINETVC